MSASLSEMWSEGSYCLVAEEAFKHDKNLRKSLRQHLGDCYCFITLLVDTSRKVKYASGDAQ